jgi:amino acid efflux transporter
VSTVERPVETAQETGGLARSVGVWQATALGVTIVVGSGTLVLPGTAFGQAGGGAFAAWVAAAVLVAPLLVIFVLLGRRYPGAAGLAGYVRAAFGSSAAAAAEFLVVGTLAPGLSTVAVAGGYYTSAAVGGGALTATVAALAVVAVAVAVNLRGIKLSGTVQQTLAVVLVSVLAVGAIGALLADAPVPAAMVGTPAEWPAGLAVVGAVFFAFTGWEMLSFTTGEFRNPKRDFPVAVAASYGIVVLLFLLIAAAVQSTLPRDAPYTATASMAGLFDVAFGPAGARLVAWVGVILVVANMIGACWAFSRLLYSSAQHGLMPRAFAVLDPKTQVPSRTILVAGGVIATVATAVGTGLLSVNLLFAVAGQSFFCLYAACALAYVKLAERRWQSVFGVAVCLLAVGAGAVFGEGLLYPAAVSIIGFVVYRLRLRHRSRASLQ